jgi:hypothetical protein
MGPPPASTEEINTTVTLNNQGLIDLLHAAVTGLQPKATYRRRRPRYRRASVSRRSRCTDFVHPLRTNRTVDTGDG